MLRSNAVGNQCAYLGGSTIVALFSNLTLVHCVREANQAADWLAKAQKQNVPSLNWVAHLSQVL